MGYSRRGLGPCHRPLIAGLAAAKLVPHSRVRSGSTACSKGTAEFLRQTVPRRPSHIGLGLMRGDSKFGDTRVRDASEVQHHLAIAAYNLCALL